MNKFYYEKDDDNGPEKRVWFVMESEAGYELGASYDLARFEVSSEDDARAAVYLLNNLYNLANK